MAVQYSQSAAARNWSLWDVAGLTEEQAWTMLRDARWGKGKQPVCPDCLQRDKHYFIGTRRQWTCRHCSHRFSVTSSTALGYHKLSFRKILMMILAFVSDRQGKSANSMQGFCQMTLKTAFHNFNKIREAMFERQNDTPLEGEVHIDCGHFCGKPRRENQRTKADSALVNHKLRSRKDAMVPDRRMHPGADNRERLKKRRIVLVMAARPIKDFFDKGNLKKHERLGSQRVKTFVIKNAKSDVVTQLVKQHVSPYAIIMTDSGSEFSKFGIELHNFHGQVNHSKEYQTFDGINNNMAETFFARLRRAELGKFNGMRHPYMALYAAECAWRDTVKRMSQREMHDDVLTLLLRKEPSKAFTNYNHGHRLGFEHVSEFRPK